MSEPTQLVRGIDLGTSNSAVAEADAGGTIRRLQPIAQLDGPGRIVEHELLPSVAYLADHRDMSPADLALPWDVTGHAPLVGRWARDLALLNPEKAVLSAKSWLCYGGGQKLARLPQGAPEDKSWTAVQASAAYLRHIQAAWDLKHQDVQPELTVLTVPASFDLVARQLTEEAAKQAGLSSVTLLEEPLAAFYAWLGAHEQHWQDVLKPGDLVLICDIGGGTSDFSLVAVSQDQGLLRLDRIAVGRHLLLGGDNMDLALAHHVQAQMGTTLDTWQFLALQQQVRVAKESLLSLDAPSHWPLAIASRGSNLFAQTLRHELQQHTVQDLLVEGFFPLVKADEEITRTRSTGLARMGLPYENDPAITRHLLQFLRQAQNTIRQSPELQERLGTAFQPDQTMVTPTALLFNGGVFHSAALRERVFSVVQSWAGHPVKELQSPGYDHAVALGAAYFARLQVQGVGVRVRAAAARSYYIGLESNEPAVPGLLRPLRGLCILPQGTEEGSHLALPEQEFGLWTGDDISFRLFSSASRSGDHLGTIVPDAERELEEVTELHCQIQSDEEPGLLPVHLRADLTDVGSLHLAMQHSLSERQWNLEFHLREEAESGHA
jgi:hypothetical protein